MYNKEGILVDTRELLRVKLKSLMEEARIIRKEERRTHGRLRVLMHCHRVLVVRQAARDTHVAYGLIRGKTIDQIEPTRHTEPNWKAIQKMVTQYGSSRLWKEIESGMQLKMAA